MYAPISDLPYLTADLPGIGGRLRCTEEDFQVEEIPAYQPDGSGDHVFAWIEKRGLPTPAAAERMARALGVSARDVGWAGMKDRHAVTRQLLSFPPPCTPEAVQALQVPGVAVLWARRHQHKLRTGHLRGNVFRIVVRGVSEEAWWEARRRLEALRIRGMPNRFGSQRFGRDGDNAARAAVLLAGGATLRDRRHARFLLSALQARVFNAVPAARRAPLDALERGDVAVLHASGGLFVVEDPEAERARLNTFALSATGPIFGTRTLAPRYAVAEREARICAAHGVPVPLRPPRGLRLRGGRRPLRVRPEDLSLERDGDAVALHFGLPRGSYATVLLEELFDASG